MTTQRLSEKNWIFLILLYLFFIYLPFVISRSETAENFLQGDCYYYRAIIDSLLEDGDLLLANNVSDDPLNGQLAIGKDGLVPKHPIIMSLVSIPFYGLFGTPGLLLFNLIDCTILMVLIFKLNSLFFSHVIAFITTTLYATGTLFLDYAYNYSPDLFSTVLLLTGLYLVLRAKYYTGALLLSLSIFAKITNALLAAVILLYAGFVVWKGTGIDHESRKSFREKFVLATTTVMIFLLASAPLAYTNYELFGSPLVTGYQRTAVAGADGQMLSVDHAGKFNQSLLKGIYRSLFDPRNGILPTNPILILAFAGIFLMRRIKHQDKVYLILLICLVQFLLFAKYDEWFTSHFSNRFLMTVVALSSVFTSNFLGYLSHGYLLKDSRQGAA